MGYRHVQIGDQPRETLVSPESAGLVRRTMGTSAKRGRQKIRGLSATQLEHDHSFRGECENEMGHLHK